MKIFVIRCFSSCFVAGLLAACAQPQATRRSSTVVGASEAKSAVVATGQTPALSSAPMIQKEGWQSLFDGQTLRGWQPTDFAGPGPVSVEQGQIILNPGVALTGINWTNQAPKTNYEIALSAMKVDGSDFFCGLTFPVAESHCSLIVGGWGGGVVGISSINGADASENETTKFMNFEKRRWYDIRVRVTDESIQAWIDNEKIVDQPIKDRQIKMRAGEIELSAPLGIAAYQTTAALKDIRMRSVNP